MPKPRMNRTFLAAAVNEQAPTATNVVSLEERRSSFGVEALRDEFGTLVGITIRMPARADADIKRTKYVLKPSWVAAGILGIPFAEAAYASAKNLGWSARGRRFDQINEFFCFLEESGRSGIDLAALTTTVFNEYVAWLNESEITARSKCPKLTNLRAVFGRLRRTPEYRDRLSPRARIPSNPWPGANGRMKPRAAISIADLVKMERACLREMAAAMARLDEGDRLIESGRSHLANGVSPSSTSLDVVLAQIADTHGACLALPKDDKQGGLRDGIIRNGGVEALQSYFHATTRTIIPFVVMLAIRTAFNAETVLRLNRSAVRTSPMLSDSVEMDGRDKRHKIVGRKNRARRDQIRTFPANDRSHDNPVVILENVARLTERLRPHAPSEQASRVFLVVMGRGAGVRSFRANDWPYFRALDQFIADNDLNSFRLANIRPTISELVDLVTGGDLKAQQIVLNHGSAEVTDGHYVSAGARARRTERLAEVQNQRERWIATGGASDTRQVEPMGTRRAVTGGFECFDPYDSPLEGQIEGRLCTAWGACADCPLAAANLADPSALARLVQLEHGIEAAKVLLPPQRWVSFWAVILKALREKWLPKFSSPEVWQRAETIALAPLPPLE
jgi:hypothetical protein